jgi:2-polyprenyl-3-methyl-5-hydroxy-6-metoxy-1,4-benzoquinol methylase
MKRGLPTIVVSIWQPEVVRGAQRGGGVFFRNGIYGNSSILCEERGNSTTNCAGGIPEGNVIELRYSLAHAAVAKRCLALARRGHQLMIGARKGRDEFTDAGASQCYSCGSAHIRQVAQEVWGGQPYHVVRCLKCDLIQTVERVDPVSPTYVDLDDKAITEDRVWCQGTHKAPAFVQWQHLMGKHVDLSIHRGRLLDMGCGTGGFLRFARDCGYEVFGFDASHAQVEYTQREFPHVRTAVTPGAYLTVLRRPDLTFKVVTLWDVLEHIRDPIALLSQVRSVLERGGCLFISVPNGGAIPWKQQVGQLRGKLPELIPWEHAFYFTPRSLRMILEQSGFRTVEIGSVVCYPRPLSLFEIARRMGFLLLRLMPRWAPQIYAIARPAT